MNTKYIHDINYGMTIGYQIDDENKRIIYAVAFKSPKDNFNRAIGRRIVDGRLAKGGISKATNAPNSHILYFSKLEGDISYRHIADVLIQQIHSKPWWEANRAVYLRGVVNKT